MRIVHLSDVHLGYRAYTRINSFGVNVREADVFKTFRESIAKIIELQPDLVVIAGDLFHVVRPSNLMIEHTFKQFLQMRGKLDAPVVLIGGNHDTPRSLDTGCILDLFRNIPDFHIVHSSEEMLRFPEMNLSVLCLCHRAIGYLDSIAVEPDPHSKYNILVAHGTVEGVHRQGCDSQEIPRERVIDDVWDYIAFGHYHSHTRLADNAYYSGSTDFTSTNIWSETAVPKGFIEYELDNRSLVAFHELEVRELVDIRTIDAAEMNADQVMQAISNRINGIEGGYQDKILRLVIENIPKSIQKDLDFSFIRDVRSKALHFDLQFRRPGDRKYHLKEHRTGASRTLEEEWREYCSAIDTPVGVDNKILTEQGLQYLRAQNPTEVI